MDVFEGSLRGLILAEAEFDSATDAASLVLPGFLGQEVTGDDRFTGDRLVNAWRTEIQRWLGMMTPGLDPGGE